MTILHSFLVSMENPAPPSVNELYTTGFHGKRVLSRKGQIFKDALTSAVVDEVMLLGWRKAVDDVYDGGAWVELTIVVQTGIFNKSWKPGRKTEKGARSSPYKKKDASSYTKVIEDAVVAGTGIDDSCHLDVRIRKVDGPLRTEVAYEIHQQPQRRR